MKKWFLSVAALALMAAAAPACARPAEVFVESNAVFVRGFRPLVVVRPRPFVTVIRGGIFRPATVIVR